jgi:hypothetical protein
VVDDIGLVSGQLIQLFFGDTACFAVNGSPLPISGAKYGPSHCSLNLIEAEERVKRKGMEPACGQHIILACAAGAHFPFSLYTLLFSLVLK